MGKLLAIKFISRRGVFALFFSLSFSVQADVLNDNMSASQFESTGRNTTPTGTSVQCSSVSSAMATDDDKGKGNCMATNLLEVNINSMVQMGTKNGASIQAEFKTYRSKWNQCVSRHNMAATVCLENLSTKISSGASAIGIIMGAGGAISSANNACSTVSQVMDIGNKVLTAYTATCTAAKTACITSCSSAMKSLNKMKSLVSSDMCPPNTACPEAGRVPLANKVIEIIEAEISRPNSTISVAGKKQLCSAKYTMLLASAATGIASMLSTMKQSNSCDDETSASNGGATGKSSAGTSGAQVSTNTPEELAADLNGQSNLIESANLNAGAGAHSSGVESAASAAVSSSDAGLNSASASSNLGSSGNGHSLDKNGFSEMARSGGASGKSESTKSGGSGGDFSGGRMTASEISNSSYGEYLPGGAKDPRMSGLDKPSGITGEGGRSNWQKIQQRYYDIRKTLIDSEQ